MHPSGAMFFFRLESTLDWSAMFCSSFVGVNTFDLAEVIQLIQLTLTLKMTRAQVVETSVTVNNKSPIQNYVHPDDHTHPPYEMTPGFKPLQFHNNRLCDCSDG